MQSNFSEQMGNVIESFDKIILVGNTGSLIAKVIALPVLIKNNKELTPQLLAVGIPFIAFNALFVWQGYKRAKNG